MSKRTKVTKKAIRNAEKEILFNSDGTVIDSSLYDADAVKANRAKSDRNKAKIEAFANGRPTLPVVVPSTVPAPIANLPKGKAPSASEAVASPTVPSDTVAAKFSPRRDKTFVGKIFVGDKVTVLVAPETAARVGSKSYDRKRVAYPKLGETDTVASFLKRGLIPLDLSWDYGRGFISITDASGKPLTDLTR